MGFLLAVFIPWLKICDLWDVNCNKSLKFFCALYSHTLLLQVSCGLIIVSPSHQQSHYSFSLLGENCWSDCHIACFSIWILLQVVWLECLNSCSDRRPGEDSDVESSRETSSAGSSDCEAERRGKGVDGAWVQHNLMNLNSQRLSRITLREKHSMSSSSDETEVYNSHGLLVFEYFEQEQPHHRQPLYDKVSH